VKGRLLVLLAAGLLLAACGTVSLATASKSWVKQSQFNSNLPTLTKDVRNSANQLHNANATANALHTVCGVLLMDSEQFNSSLPTPDDQATALLSKAFSDFGAGANKCYGAQKNPAARASALSWLSRGMAELSEGRARINVATGAAP
jgi:hypothetical protein